MRNRFDRQLKKLNDELIEMGSMIEKSIEKALVALVTQNVEKAKEILLEKEIDIPIIGVVKPGAKTAARATVNKKIGVIATEGTISSGMYEEFLKSSNPEVEVYGKSCPLFVPLAEECWLNDPVTKLVAERYLAELKEKQIDTLVLGCTHYPLLRHTLQKVVGDKVRLVNPAYETAMDLKRILMQMDMENPDVEGDHGSYSFYVSDAADKFKQFANSILPYDIETTKQINIEEY